LLIEDRSNKEIARILSLSANTVKVYIRFLMKKMDAASRTGIVSKVLSERV
jgi:DNA-binding NarL/FixJ family response regulator